ncbi:sulfotransferase domain-containing protein [Psychroflexus aestuariivivens]|uniref:sulfotransferase domain-containing protein n=1 Tax=Psychroflexus aestuariivivens TaxID=1795040 RepID=UPI000FD6FA71|nr:sulfotransferase domain-containing protein [Psychroflexus aestuariivivens]
MNKLALFSVPRSGSSWLGEILNSSPEVIYKFQPNFAYSFEAELKSNSSKNEIDDFFQRLYVSKDDFVNGRLSISGKKRDLKFYKQNPSTLLFKETHYLNIIDNLLKKSETKIIGLIRSPFATINSWLSIPKEFNPDWDVEKEWKDAPLKNGNLKSNYFGYNKWKEVCFMFLNYQEKYPKQFYLINYNQLIVDVKSEIENLYRFCELDFSLQTQEFINKSTQYQSEDAYSVFKEKKNDLGWQKTLPKFIEEKIKKDEDFIKLNQIFKWI